MYKFIGAYLMDIEQIRKECKETIEAVRANSPLVHNITNLVVTNTVANMLLAAHASPLMAHDPRELEDINAISGALVVNIGTLDASQIDSMKLALKYAKDSKKPSVLDPVGAGASKLRTQTSLDLLAEGMPNVLRANPSEIIALAIASGHEVSQNASRGVDANDSATNALSSAKFLAEKFACTVSMTGEKDYVVSNDGIVTIDIAPRTPHLPLTLITKITGMGCSCSALHGATLAVNNNSLIASIAALTLLKTANNKAISSANGPASLQTAIIDSMYKISVDEIMKTIFLSQY